MSYDSEPPQEVLKQILKLYDKKNEVDLMSDDYLTVFPETHNGKQIAINMHITAKDYKTAVFDVMAKAHKLGRGWKVFGPMRVKKYFFSMSLDKKDADEIVQGVNGISIILNNARSEIDNAK